MRPHADPAAAGALSAFYYGKAVATVLNRRLGEAAVSLLSEASKAVTDAPLQLQSFQVRRAHSVCCLQRPVCTGATQVQIVGLKNYKLRTNFLFTHHAAYVVTAVLPILMTHTAVLPI